MSNTQNLLIDNNNNEQYVKRGRGRPKKGEVVVKPPVEKGPNKPIGRPRNYEEGYNDHKFKCLQVDRKEYKRLLKIEQKYLEIKNTIE